MKNATSHSAKVLTEQELRNVIGGIRKPATQVGSPGSGSTGANGDIHAQPYERKG